MTKITRPVNRPQSQCIQLRSLLARLEQQLSESQAMLTRLENQHASESTIQEWVTTIKDLNSEIEFVQQEIRYGCAPPPPPPPPVSPPASGLGSNSNYILYSNCDSILGLTVTIDVTQDIVCKSASGSTKGFGFQLNAYSPKNETSAWQQYVIALFGSQLVAAVDNWPVSGANIINNFTNLLLLPSAKLPAGYKIQISLANDAGDNITAATYVVTDNVGNTAASHTTTLTSLSGVTSADLAPIVAFELNLVGPVNSESAVLSSGGGAITYSASTPLTVLNKEPACTESGYITAETANSFYGVMPPGPGTSLIQGFDVTQASPMISKPGKPRPSTHISKSRIVKLQHGDASSETGGKQHPRNDKRCG